MPAVDGAVRKIVFAPPPEGPSAAIGSVPTDVSDVVVVASVERLYRTVVAADRPSPWLCTVTISQNVPPVSGLLSLTFGPSTTKSGADCAATPAGSASSSAVVRIARFLSISHEPDVQPDLRRQFAALVAFAQCFSGIVTLNVLVLAPRPG